MEAGVLILKSKKYRKTKQKMEKINKNNNEIIHTETGICIGCFKAFGIKEEKYGVALIVNDMPCETAAVFTKNTAKAAPVLVNIGKLNAGSRFQAVIVNSGNANCCTKTGIADANEMCEIASGKLNINPDKILVASTGIIGKKLDVDKIRQIVNKINVSESNSKSLDAAKAIMTTDTVPKEISIEYKGIKIGGIIKGVGMIAPNVATMLCFLSTNAGFGKEKLQSALKIAVNDSFNMLVIDDMSTNDTVILMSNGKFKCNSDDFQYALNYACIELAKKLAFDGEGATKFFEVTVRGAKSKDDARKGARAVVSSYLVKSAIFGENPNWGRIAGALGTVIKFDFQKTDVVFESGNKSYYVVTKGEIMDLKPAAEILKNREIKVTVDLNSGSESATAYGCDLSYGYVKINAEYN